MTGIDYRREWHLIRQEENSLKSHVYGRLVELIKIYPMARINKSSRMEASSITEHWLSEMSTELQISIIENIEKWSAEQQGVRQLEI
jgi:hypothetical protein